MRYIRENEFCHADASKYAHTILYGEAIRFHNTLPGNLAIRPLVDEIKGHFNSKTRQKQARSDLAQLRLVKVKREKNMDTRTALDHIRKELSSKITQCPPGYCTEEHKNYFLIDAVTGED